MDTYPKIAYSIIGAVAVYNGSFYIDGEIEGGVRKWDGSAWVTALN